MSVSMHQPILTIAFTVLGPELNLLTVKLSVSPNHQFRNLSMSLPLAGVHFGDGEKQEGASSQEPSGHGGIGRNFACMNGFGGIYSNGVELVGSVIVSARDLGLWFTCQVYL